jgi:rfaE bifunctional protein nucleotidyltransferase chain/domain
VTVTAPADKLATLDELVAERESWRRQGLVVVVANGAFDLLHVGHLRYLAGARAAGDMLVVAVNSDRSVQLSKGPSRPIMPEAERVELLSHLWMVDRMCLFDTETVAPVLEALRPDVHAKGTDYTVETVPERETMRALGGRTVIVGDPKDHATTDVIATILERFGRRR